MLPTRIPTKEDFASILPSHPTYQARQQQQRQQQQQQQGGGRGGGQPDDPIVLVYPNPPESTTAILLLFHGLGDTEAAFASFARNLALPGVLAISVRGTAPLPPALLPPSSSTDDDGGDGGRAGYHWGDDLTFTRDGEAIDPDPGFGRARAWVVDRLIGDVLVRRCGWAVADILLFGFGQGASFALGLASALRKGDRVVEVVAEDDDDDDETSAKGATDWLGRGGGRGGNGDGGKAFKGVVAIGGPLPMSMVPTVGGLGKSKTPVLVCCGRESEAVDEDAVEVLEREFENVKVVRWKRNDDGMPRNREEALPMMQFFAEKLRNVWL
ncbi:hypothetical protein VTH82DRAFT_1953 [Thermothelomyces myriococcoides]